MFSSIQNIFRSIPRKAIHHAQQEEAVEEKIEEAYRVRQRLGTVVQELSSSPFNKGLPTVQKGELDSILLVTEDELKAVDPFFNKFCSQSTADDDINKNNYHAADTQLQQTSARLQGIETRLNKGRTLVEDQRGLQATRKELDSTIAAIRTASPTGIYAQQTEAVYQNGISSVEARKLPAAKNHLEELHRLVQEDRGLQSTRQQLDTTLAGIKSNNPLKIFVDLAQGMYEGGMKAVEERQLSTAQGELRRLQNLSADAQQYRTLSTSVEQIYQSINRIVKESDARKEAERLYRESQGYLETANVARLQQSVGALQELDRILREEYTFKIVGARWRDNSSLGVRLYYAKVQAVDAQGNHVPQTIVNQETGNRHQNLDLWGEEIPPEIYDQIAADKKDDGIINTITEFGRKERGYRSLNVNLKDGQGRLLPRKGQITID